MGVRTPTAPRAHPDRCGRDRHLRQV